MENDEPSIQGNCLVQVFKLKSYKFKKFGVRIHSFRRLKSRINQLNISTL